LGDLIIFLVIGLFLNLIFLRQSSNVRFQAVILVLSSLVFLSVFLRINRLATWAALILALGMGVTAMRLILAKKAWFNAIVRLTLPWMCVILVLVASGMLIYYP
jgi:hypothetical protein